MEILSLLNAPFVALDNALPFVLLLISALILTGNFALKSFFDCCGISLYGRYLYGAAMVFLGAALLTGLELLATQVLIVLLIGLAVLATRRGGSREVALVNIVIAAILVPVAIIP